LKKRRAAETAEEEADPAPAGKAMKETAENPDVEEIR
jgi:hypothetical protein